MGRRLAHPGVVEFGIAGQQIGPRRPEGAGRCVPRRYVGRVGQRLEAARRFAVGAKSPRGKPGGPVGDHGIVASGVQRGVEGQFVVLAREKQPGGDVGAQPVDFAIGEELRGVLALEQPQRLRVAFAPRQCFDLLAQGIGAPSIGGGKLLPFRLRRDGGGRDRRRRAADEAGWRRLGSPVRTAFESQAIDARRVGVIAVRRQPVGQFGVACAIGAVQIALRQHVPQQQAVLKAGDFGIRPLPRAIVLRVENSPVTLAVFGRNDVAEGELALFGAAFGRCGRFVSIRCGLGRNVAGP